MYSTLTMIIYCSFVTNEMTAFTETKFLIHVHVHQGSAPATPRSHDRHPGFHGYMQEH